jgi:multidrug efflux pump subunit AcrA (membrane-fusion protein)
VARISWAVDSSTRTLHAEIDLSNADGRLRPGMYAYATLSAELTNGLTLPHSAVATEGDVTRGYSTYCYQVEDGTAQRIEVLTGSADGERIQMLKKQLRAAKPGQKPRWVDFTGKEVIVINGIKGLTDGLSVTVTAK